MKILIYTIIFAIANLAVYFGIMKAWKEELDFKESLPVEEISLDTLLYADYFSLPIYFKLKNIEVKEEMAEVITQIYHPRLSEYVTHCMGLIPIVEKGSSIHENPILVWMYFFKRQRYKTYNWQIPFDVNKWKSAGKILQVLRYDSLHDEELGKLLGKIYKKYGITPVNPEKMRFVSPLMQKVDWSPYNKVLKYLIILDIFGFLPILLALILKLLQK